MTFPLLKQKTDQLSLFDLLAVDYSLPNSAFRSVTGYFPMRYVVITYPTLPYIYFVYIP